MKTLKVTLQKQGWATQDMEGWCGVLKAHLSVVSSPRNFGHIVYINIHMVQYSVIKISMEKVEKGLSG